MLKKHLKKGGGKMVGETSEAIVFFNGDFVPESRAKIPIFCHALNYGTGVFEGIRAWWKESEENLYVFALQEHLERFFTSCGPLKISILYSLTNLGNIIVTILRKNQFRENVYIRPLAFKISSKIGVKLSGLDDCLAIFAIPFRSYYPDETKVRAVISSWRRIPDNAIPPRIKCCGAYVNSALAKEGTLSLGFDEAILLNEDGTVAEASAANLFIVRDEILITPPPTANILEGITRKIIMTIAKEEFGIEVREREIGRSELTLADEVFITGTACNVSAIVEVDGVKIGNGEVGFITAKLRNFCFAICLGEEPKYKHLLTPVY